MILVRDPLRRNARQFVGLAVVTAVTLIGALWYWLVEGIGLVDSFYQAVITVSTVGFGEVVPLDTSGRIFTIVLIVFGVAAVVYALGGFAELLIESSIQRFSFRRKERTLERMSGHTVVCGYGRTGAAVVRLLPPRTDVGVIELDADRVDEATADGYLAIQGDSTTDETLSAAGIERAARLIVCLSTDSDAISTVLSARVLNPEVRIVSRVNDANVAPKLRMAGADHVVSPVEMGARRMVTDSVEPRIGTFIDAALHEDTFGLSLRALTLSPDLADPVTVKEVEQATGVRVVGRDDGAGGVVEPGPTDKVLHPGETLVAVGHPDELAELERFISR